LHSKRSIVSAMDNNFFLPSFVFSLFFDTAEFFHILLDHTVVPRTTDQSLSSWVYRQRKQHSLGKLSEYRMNKLNDVS
jgi:hypothetical protein